MSHDCMSVSSITIWSSIDTAAVHWIHDAHRERVIGLPQTR